MSLPPLTRPRVSGISGCHQTDCQCPPGPPCVSGCQRMRLCMCSMFPGSLGTVNLPGPGSGLLQPRPGPCPLSRLTARARAAFQSPVSESDHTFVHPHSIPRKYTAAFSTHQHSVHNYPRIPLSNTNILLSLACTLSQSDLNIYHINVKSCPSFVWF